MRLPQGYRTRGVWVGNSSTIETTQTLKDTNNNYLISRLSDSPVLTLKGRPIFEQNDIADGTLYYGDFSYYKIVDREGVRVRISDEATVASQSAFERDLTFVRVEKRTDGELTLTQAIRSVSGI
jgi:HK97 family phage major capsid protein